jgi:hypothetical protein
VGQGGRGRRDGDGGYRGNGEWEVPLREGQGGDRNIFPFMHLKLTIWSLWKKMYLKMYLRLISLIYIIGE